MVHGFPSRCAQSVQMVGQGRCAVKCPQDTTRRAEAPCLVFISAEATDPLCRPCPSLPRAPQNSCWEAEGCLAPLGGQLWGWSHANAGSPHTVITSQKPRSYYN